MSHEALFICHATEDKETVARPLAEQLVSSGLSVWYDEYSLRLGDSLRESIDRGLATCRYGIVIVSPSFFTKPWTREELDGLTAREITTRQKVILPVWHQMMLADVTAHSPSLAGKLAVSTDRGIPHVARRIVESVRDNDANRGISEIEFPTGFGGSVFLRGRPNDSGPMTSENMIKVLDRMLEVFKRDLDANLKDKDRNAS